MVGVGVCVPGVTVGKGSVVGVVVGGKTVFAAGAIGGKREGVVNVLEAAGVENAAAAVTETAVSGEAAGEDEAIPRQPASSQEQTNQKQIRRNILCTMLTGRILS